MFGGYNENTMIGEGMNHDMMHGLMDVLGCNKETPESNALSLDPASMTGGQKSQAPPNMQVAVRKPKKKDEKAIWQPEEFKQSSGVVVKEEGDDRAIPKYEMLHRQKLGTTDTYLNMMEMDPSSDHCQELLVKIYLPETQLKDISLDVLEDRVLLQAPKHRLNLALPNKVRKDEGNAKWDKLKGILSVTVPIDTKIKYFSKIDDVFDEDHHHRK